MTIDRACEILDPEHREHYESIEPVEEACRMGIAALREKQERERGVDMVKVIRCHECKYSFVVRDQDGGRHQCCVENGRRDMKDDDFCSYGERRK